MPVYVAILWSVAEQMKLSRFFAKFNNSKTAEVELIK